MQEVEDNRKDVEKQESDTFLLPTSKRGKRDLCLCGLSGGFLKNSIVLNSRIQKVPTQWTEGNLTATQLVEGKIKKKVLRKGLVVLVQVEDENRKWFEVTRLRQDLSYPFTEALIGIRTHCFHTLKEARKHFDKTEKLNAAESKKLLNSSAN